MAYYLGIDLGTTYTAAAIERGGLVEALTLGNRTASVPSVVFLRDDGEILVGEAATRRATSEPGRVGREFKRRVGDPTPIILGGTPYAAEMLMARVLRWSVDRVQEQQGGQAQAIALTHPANWGPYKLDLLAQAVRQVEVDVAMTLPEPVAAATFYASQRRLDPGAVVAVYDLGGGTFDAAMVRRKTDGFEVIGSPEGIERLGGIDFDEAVFAHVRSALGDALELLDPDEPASVSAMARLRQECIDAKEALSSDTDVSIPVLLPNLQTEVRLTRSEFEDMIRPAINETIVALRRSIRSANVSSDEITAVLLVGGSSRIPLVAQMVATELGRPIAIDAHPKDAISFGAAIAVAASIGQATPETVTTVLPDQRPPPPTMDPTGGQRPAPPAPSIVRPAPPTQAPPQQVPVAARPTPQAPAAHAAPPGNPAGMQQVAARAPATSPGPYAQPQQPQPQSQPQMPAARPTAPTGPPAGMPGVQQPTYGGGYGQPSGYSSGGYQAGAQPPSGGYTAQRRTTQGTDSSDRMTLMIAIGVVAVALLIILVALIFRSREAGAYTAGVKHDFVSRCMGNDNSTETCECIIEKVAASVEFEDFKAYADALDEDPSTEQPSWLTSAVDSCNSAEQPTST
jgi:actin-like ATPase involved in cell morphogenesis